MNKTSKVRVAHVDDSEDTVQRVKTLLEADASVEYVAGFRDAESALDFLKREQVDLLLLDVEMPGRDGLWLAEQLQQHRMEIVFITSYAGYATKAFEVCALDYVMKPMNSDKLHVALERFRYKQKEGKPDIYQQIEAIYQYLDPRKKPSRIFVKSAGRTDVIRLDDIVHFAGSGNYTTVITVHGEEFLSSRPIKTYEDALLHHPDFVRISRSGIVNKKYIKAIERHETPRRVTIHTVNGSVIETSFRTKEDLLKLLSD